MGGIDRFMSLNELNRVLRLSHYNNLTRRFLPEEIRGVYRYKDWGGGGISFIFYIFL
jgi:hypothetical protein